MPELPARPSLAQLHKQAKDLLRLHRSGDPAAITRFDSSGRPAGTPILADAQFVIAREYGFDTWAKLKSHVESLNPPSFDHYDALARSLAAAYTTGDKDAIRDINWTTGSSFVWDHEPTAMQRRLPTWFASSTRDSALAVADARRIVAHARGFDSWDAFLASAVAPPANPRSAPVFLSSTPPFYKIDWHENRVYANGPQSARDWDAILAVIHEHAIPKLSAGGITDAVMARLPELDHVTHLQLDASKGLTDDGARHLARMPQLLDLELGGWTSRITDRALEALRHLPALRRFQSAWTQSISDVGLSNLAFCPELEEVDLIGANAGDGTIRALAGNPNLRRFVTGRNVTDVGLSLFHEFPVFKTWQGVEPEFSIMSFRASPIHLMIDGPFTDSGLASLAGLDGLPGLSFFWHCPNFTSAGLAHLHGLSNLVFLGCQDHHCDDEAMRHIASIPRLRMLMGQGATASDKGFAALSRSQSLEYFWGRDAPNFGSAGFAALSQMPALRGLAVSLKNVDDDALSLLPHFPALRQLMPMDVADDGFRHIGLCRNLDKLWCMYCRDTGDRATEHLAALSSLKLYYAGMTKITDRSLEILAGMNSLEELEFWQCAGITTAGIARLAVLPHLRRVSLDGLQNVSRDVLSRFPAHVRVSYSG
jgi:hypothetical protein